MKKTDTTFKLKPIIGSIFIISICSIVYELIIAATSTYLLGNSIKQFSITIGLYMSAMGLGSYLSKFIHHNKFNVFMTIELLIGFIGGFSAITLFYAYARTDLYVFVMYIIIIIIGILVGLEIPLLTRIIEERNSDLRVTLANVLSFDYIGGLIGSLAFPLLLYPSLGLIRTSFLIGALNIIVAGLILTVYKSYISKSRFFTGLFLVFILLSIIGFITGEASAHYIDQKLYRDQIIYETQTPYQKLVMTRHRDDVRVFLNGNIQFSTTDEYRYHEALVYPVMTATDQPERVLILGGGDGMALREVLKFPSVKHVDLVDIDKDMVDFCRTNPLIKGINKGSLESEKLSLHYKDAFKFLEKEESLYDVVIVDLPDPNDESLNKLYTNIFYRLIGNHLTESGVFVAQSTSPYYAGKAYWCINKTMASEGFHVIPYHLEVPSFGDWGFQIASNTAPSPDPYKIPDGARYYTPETFGIMQFFAKDETVDMTTLELNTVFKPVLLGYYEEAVQNF